MNDRMSATLIVAGEIVKTNVSRASTRVRLRTSESPGNYVRYTPAMCGAACAPGWRVFREHSGRDWEAEAAGARCGALMTGNRQYELDGSVPHSVPQ